MISWKIIAVAEDLETINKESFHRPQVIFKHSTCCGSSFLVKESLENEKAPAETEFHFLDLIRHRTISDSIESTFNVQHASPQILVIRNGRCIYHKSHSGIRMEKIAEIM